MNPGGSLPLVDTHCHLDFEAFSEDREMVLERAWQAGLVRILIPGINLPSSRAAVRLAVSHPALYAAVGIHPNDTAEYGRASLAGLREILDDFEPGRAGGKVAAIGEIGLDYYRQHASPAAQRRAFLDQLDLAAERKLPVVIHNRQASADLLAILADWQAGLAASGSPLANRPGVLHSFSEDLETARAAIELNFNIGITGPVTFRNAPDLQRVVAGLPLDRLLIETDAPFLAPQPLRGQRNEPAYVRLVADKIAGLHNLPAAAVAEATTSNAGRLFGWILG
jgi:TatD DNase family protein